MEHNITAISMSANALYDGVNALAELLAVYADGVHHDDPARITVLLHGLSALLGITGAQLLDHCEALSELERIARTG